MEAKISKHASEHFLRKAQIVAKGVHILCITCVYQRSTTLNARIYIIRND